MTHYPARKLVQIAALVLPESGDTVVYGLCNDGTFWFRRGGEYEWNQVKPPSKDEPPKD